MTQERLELFEALGLPDVFTTDPNSSRIHVVYMRLLTRKFIEAENAKRPTLGIMLTALFYGWDQPNAPYSAADRYNLHIFEISDHSSYPELIDFVTKTKPKEVVPIVSSAVASGFMKDWPEFHKYRINMKPFQPLCSRIPPKLIEIPTSLNKINAMALPDDYPAASKRKRQAVLVKERIYRGPKGPVYESMSSVMASVASSKESETASVYEEHARKLEVCAKQLELCATKDTLNGLNACIENLRSDLRGDCD